MIERTRGSAKPWHRRPFLFIAGILIAGIAVFGLAACDDGETSSGQGTEPANGDLSGTISADGSSTVFPISEAVAEEFMAANSGVRVTVGTSGTGGGFEAFCAGETDISNASRPIDEDEIAACAAGGVEFEEFQVAYDGLSVVVNPALDFVDCLTVAELKTIWEPAADSTVTNWSQVRAGFPDHPLTLYGPGTDSGTFDYFTEEIVGEAGASRADYTSSEDDNQLIIGITGDDDASGYFGFAYYEQNQGDLGLVAVDSGTGCVAPSRETILDGTYAPLSRPLYVYASTESLARPEVAEFMRFYLTEGAVLAADVGYVEAPDNVYQEGLAKIP